MNKTFVILGVSTGFLMGCSHTGMSDRGSSSQGLDNQPGSAVTAEGALMPGAFDAGPTMHMGQFTGQERSQARVGQYPVPPREADVREMDRSDAPTQVDESTENVRPGQETPEIQLTAKDMLLRGRVSTSADAPTLAQPLTSGDISSVGGSRGVEVGIGSQSLPPDPSSAASWTPTGNNQGTVLSVTPDLSGRVRDALTTGRPSSISTLTTDRVEQIRIEALNGNVTLRGNVRSETEKLMLHQKISQVPGVSTVNNQLRVVSPDRKGMDDGTQPEDRTDILTPEK